MKPAALETLFTEFVDGLIAAEAPAEEVELGFETMLSSDVIEFLKSGCKPLAQKLTGKSGKRTSDEHELATV